MEEIKTTDNGLKEKLIELFNGYTAETHEYNQTTPNAVYPDDNCYTVEGVKNSDGRHYLNGYIIKIPKEAENIEGIVNIYTGGGDVYINGGTQKINDIASYTDGRELIAFTGRDSAGSPAPDTTSISNYVNTVAPNNSNIKSYTVIGHSMGASQAFKSATNYLEECNEAGTKPLQTNIISLDGNTVRMGAGYNTTISEEDIELLRKNNVTVTHIVSVNDPQKANSNAAEIGTLAKEGVPVLLIEQNPNEGKSKYGHEDLYNTECWEEMGLYDYITGDSKTLKDNERVSFSYKVYNTAKGEWQEISDASAENFSKTGSLITYKPISITETDEISADYNIVANSVNSIKSAIGNTEYLTNQQSINCDSGSTSAIPAGLNLALNSYFDMNTALLKGISAQADTMMAICDSTLSVDEKFSQIAQELNSNLGIDSSNVTSELSNNKIIFDFNLSDLFASSDYNDGSNKIYLSDLTSILSGSNGVLSSLTQDVYDSRNAQSTLYDVKSNIGQQLKGAAWEAYGNQLDSYIECLSLRETAAVELQTAIIKASQLLIDYMGNYEYIDFSDTRKQELIDEKNDLLNLIEECNQKISATKIVTVDAVYNVEGKLISPEYEIEEPLYSSAEKANFLEQMRGYEMQIREVINPEIEKIEGFPEIMAKAEKIIDDAMTEIENSYGNAVANVLNSSANLTM